ncbi:MAG: hypothetical protein RIF37_13500 [Rhodospirillaceae bacterium]
MPPRHSVGLEPLSSGFGPQVFNLSDPARTLLLTGAFDGTELQDVLGLQQIE